MAPMKRTAQLRLSLLLVLAALTLAACGGGGGSGANAEQLLKATFGSSHTVNSGELSFSLSLDPSGSTSLTSPISLSFGGPFQTRGQGKLPASNFQLAVSGAGQKGSLGILSTGTAGYVTLSGTSYALPAATFQKLESSFASVTKSGGGLGGGGVLSKLGIQPLRWLTSPTVVGEESVGGAPTMHVRAGVDVGQLLADLSKLLSNASSLGVSGASSLTGGISASTRQQIARSVHGAKVDVWTGKSDHTLRRLALSIDVPVTGSLSSELGGLKRAAIALDMQYAKLNQPQQIAAPTNVRPYSEFQTKLSSIVQSLQGAASGATGGATRATGATGATGSTTGSTTGATGSTGASGTDSAYARCLQSAGTDVTKMQGCASLLNGR